MYHIVPPHCTGTQDLLAVMNATKDITDWSVLALCLGISEADYEKIKQKSIAQGRNLHKDVVNKWFATGRASWAALVKCLLDGTCWRNWTCSENS